MKRNLLLLGIVLLISLTACSSNEQTVLEDEAIFYGEGEFWNVSYIYDPELYEEKKVNWVEMESKDVQLSPKDLSNIDIEFQGRDGVLLGNAADMITKLDDNVLSFLIGTANLETYKEDTYTITITFNEKQDVIKLKFLD